MCKCVISRVGNYSRSIGNIWSAEELVIYRRWSGVGFWQFVRRTLLRTSRVALDLFTLKVSHLNFQPCVWMTALCASLPVATDHPDHAAIDVQVGWYSPGKQMRLHCEVGGSWSWGDFPHFLMIREKLRFSTSERYFLNLCFENTVSTLWNNNSTKLTHQNWTPIRKKRNSLSLLLYITCHVIFFCGKKPNPKNIWNIVLMLNIARFWKLKPGSNSSSCPHGFLRWQAQSGPGLCVPMVCSVDDVP